MTARHPIGMASCDQGLDMSSTEECRLDDRQLERYVLGLLSDEEAERLDEVCIADDEAASRLRIVEDDLVDAYVRGTLSGGTLERFESYYLASPRRRERVKLAARFVRSIDRAARADSGAPRTPALASTADCDEGVPVPRAVQRHRMTVRSPLAWKLALAAALVLVVSGTLLFETVRLRNRLSVAQQERAALDRRVQDLEQRLNDRLASTPASSAEPAGPRESLAKAPLRDAGVPAREGPPREAPAVALVLLPQTRSVASVPTVAIPPGADRVPFDLRLESNDFPRYQAGLKDPATNQIVWRSGWIEPSASGGEPSISVTVPAGVLKPQHYSLDVTGPGADGPRVVGSYAFQVLQ